MATDETLDRLSAYARHLFPDLADTFLEALRTLAAGVSEATLVRMIERGDVVGVIELLFSPPIVTTAFLPFREALRQSIGRAGQYFHRQTPQRIVVPRPSGNFRPPVPPGRVGVAAPGPRAAVRIGFDAIDDRVLNAIRTYERKTVIRLTEDAQASVRQALEAGLREGVNPRDMARNIRGALGLTPRQEQAVRNFRRMLEEGDREVLTRALRDRRYDRTIRAALEKGKPLTAEQVEKMTAAYRQRFIAHHAEDVARTASLDAMKEGQRLSWEQAIADGRVREGDLEETWHTKMDGRERPAHHEMHLKTKGFRELWDVPGVGPQRYPGESEYNCRCVTFVRPRRKTRAELAAGAA